jgi:hypothetical protein
MTKIFGVRHHGPGSALSLRAALHAYQPDCVLIEGPPEADALLPLLRDPEYRPPLALLISRADAPAEAMFYPFVEFSPEWIALHYALSHDIRLSFCDWPAAAALAYRTDAESAPEQTHTPLTSDEQESDPDDVSPATRIDPIALLAQAAGESDPEVWWDSLVEQQPSSLEVFDALNEAMAATRSPEPDKRNRLREAWMRHSLREAQKTGAQKIAVVCGAFHGPALLSGASAKADAADLAEVRSLTKSSKVDIAWVPWSQSRLSLASAYGAGMSAPAWYADIFAAKQRAHVRFLARAAACLRQMDLEAASASVIEAVRLSETLAAMRGRALPGLAEVREAALSVLARGDVLRYQLIASALEIAERFGSVPENAPSLPLRRDFEVRLKTLRLKRAADSKVLDLDLREPAGLARSSFFHQCQLLGLAFAKSQRNQVRSQGSFHEFWTLQFVPEDELKLIEASQWGASVEEAATFAALRDLPSKTLDALCASLELAIDAELPNAVPRLLSAISAGSASSDAALLLVALPPLLNLYRYGSVRGFKPERIAPMLQVMLERLSVGLNLSARGINSEAADSMITHLQTLRPGIEVSQRQDWQQLLAQTIASLSASVVHPMLRGFAARFAFDQGDATASEFSASARLALSPVVAPTEASDWILGALKGPVVVLQHGALLRVIDQWLSTLHESDFVTLLPALRRAFCEFDSNERRVIAAAVASTEQKVSPPTALEYDAARVALVLPTILELLP